jgi:4a-hydroxytetrahydrobiopterin dehydratase
MTTDRVLTRQEASDAVTGRGWRLVLGALVTSVPVGSLAEAARIAAQMTAAIGSHPGQDLRLDIRNDRLILSIQSAVRASVTTGEVGLAHRISAFVTTLGLATDAAAGSGTGTGREPRRSAQLLEIGIDALDIAAIRPFWKAILGYGDEPGASGPEDAIADLAGQGPAIWFQQMDAPRPQRNRIHFDISVPHDEAQARMQAALAAGGRLVYVAEAPAFWVLADAEGNEACITTWQGRDG